MEKVIKIPFLLFGGGNLNQTLSNEYLDQSAIGKFRSFTRLFDYDHRYREYIKKDGAAWIDMPLNSSRRIFFTAFDKIDQSLGRSELFVLGIFPDSGQYLGFGSYTDMVGIFLQRKIEDWLSDREKKLPTFDAKIPLSKHAILDQKNEKTVFKVDNYSEATDLLNFEYRNNDGWFHKEFIACNPPDEICEFTRIIMTTDFYLKGLKISHQKKCHSAGCEHFFDASFAKTKPRDDQSIKSFANYNELVKKLEQLIENQKNKIISEQKTLNDLEWLLAEIESKNRNN